MRILTKIKEIIIKMKSNVMMVMINQGMDAIIIILNKIGIALLEFNLRILYVKDVYLIVYSVHLMLIVNNAMMGIIFRMVFAYNANHNVKLA